MTEKGVDFTQRVWETHISRKKDNSESDDGDSVLDPNEFLDLKVKLYTVFTCQVFTGIQTPISNTEKTVVYYILDD